MGLVPQAAAQFHEVYCYRKKKAPLRQILNGVGIGSGGF
jgi:hypothetical protein